MITKGIVEEVLNNAYVKVRCPTFDKLVDSSLGNKNLIACKICSIPGINILPKKNDVVFVGFENNDRSKPIVLGFLFLNDSIESSSSLDLSSIEVINSLKLPESTSIGNITSFNLKTLEGLSSNLKQTLNSIDEDISEKNLSLENLSSSIDSLKLDISNLKIILDSNIEKTNNIKEYIGSKDDDTNTTLFGFINNLNKKIENINSMLGIFSKDNTLADMISNIDNLFSSLRNRVSTSSVVVGNEENCMLTRAEKMINIEWKSIYSFKKWNSDSEFKANSTYVGMPYTLFGTGYTYDAWKAHASNNRTMSGTVPGYGYREGPMYGSCCADFVSEVIGIPAHQRSCYGLSMQSDYLTKLSGSDSSIDNIKAGDVLLNANGGHVMWVGKVNGDELTIYEQNPPVAHKFTLSKSKNNKNNHLFWGSEYSYILRPTEKLLSLECNIAVDNSTNIKDDWVYKGSHYNTDIKKMLLTEDEYLHNGLIFWKMCKKAGWTAEAAAGCWANTYGESSGNPWSYGTAGGGILGYTPFDYGYNGAGIYDYALDILGDAEKRWDGNVQVDYINWLIDRVKNRTLYKVFFIRKPLSKYWSYDPPSTTNIPSNDFDIDTYIKLDNKNYGATATICAKLWLARAGVVDLDYGNRRTEAGLQNVIVSHSKKAEELYQLFLQY